MEETALKAAPQGAPESETQRRLNSRRLGRLARDRESLREMRAILDRIYGKSRRS